MPRVTEIVDPPVFSKAVRARIARFDGERATFAPSVQPPERPITDRAIAALEAHYQSQAERVIARYEHALATRDHNAARELAARYEPTWTSALSVERLAASVRDEATLHAQNHEHTLCTSALWSALLGPEEALRAALEAAADRAAHEGWWLRAQAFRAGARWLGATQWPDALRFDGVDPRPQRARTQPDPAWRALDPIARRWHIERAEGARLAALPSILAHAADESFLVRAQAYRSLGRVGHPAGIVAVRAGLRDAHPFARAQAARSLGWLGDAGSVSALWMLARRDMDEETQRASRDALARILVFWEYWGEWPAVLSDRARVATVAERLRAMGAFGAVQLPVERAPSCGRPSLRIQGHRYEPSAYDDEATRELDAQRNAGNAPDQLLSRIDDALARNDLRAFALCAAAVSMQRAFDCEPRLRSLCAHDERSVAFHARRACDALRSFRC